MNPTSTTSFRWFVWFILATGALLALAGCEKDKVQALPATVESSAPAPKAAELTLLITADENGALLPVDHEGKSSGGAAEMFALWKSKEKHCVPGAPSCSSPTTLALSTGDHFAGPSVSSYFLGESTAQVMNKMGYAASSMGNHELDFGRQQFVKNVASGGFGYLAANLKVRDAEAKEIEPAPFKIFDRGGIKVGVIGLANSQAARTTMSGRFAGIDVSGYEEALSEVLPKVTHGGADVVVVLADECPTQLEPTFAKHADWKVALVAGGHCHKPYEKKVGLATLVSPGRQFASYLRTTLKLDPSKPLGQQVSAVDTRVVKVKGATADPDLAKLIASWKAKNDAALGAEIGFTKTGLPLGSPALGQWVGRALAESFRADVAIVNKKGIRQGVPSGKITKATVYSALPFDNSVLLLRLKGAALSKALANPEAIYAGVTPSGKTFKDSKGKPIDPAGNYQVATLEYLYFGGDGFALEQEDPAPSETGQVWQTPVIEWTRSLSTSPTKPLEKRLK